MALDGMAAPRRPSDASPMEVLGALAFLSCYCPRHKSWTAAHLKLIFEPAVRHGTARVFRNEDGTPCAALVWARLNDESAHALLSGQRPLTTDEWVGGDTLWFVDLFAPFGHGAQVARWLARNPPDEPFQFARFGDDGELKKIVMANASAAPGERLYALSTDS